MHWPDISQTFGFAGVSKYECLQAKRWGRVFEWPMVFVAVWVPIQWYLDFIGILPSAVRVAFDWIVWVLFVVETTWISVAVRDKKRYFKENWMNVVIIVFGFPFWWQTVPLAGGLRILRLIVILGVFVRLIRISRKVLQQNSLGTTLLVSFVVIILSGIFISILDPAIESAGEGIWWAWVTVTTVGYGDLVPTSPAGRIFGGMLILLGVGLFALLTANFSAVLIGREVTDVGKEVGAVGEEESLILGRLTEIEKRLTRIEYQLSKEIQYTDDGEDCSDQGAG